MVGRLWVGISQQVLTTAASAFPRPATGTRSAAVCQVLLGRRSIAVTEKSATGPRVAYDGVPYDNRWLQDAELPNPQHQGTRMGIARQDLARDRAFWRELLARCHGARG